MIRSSGEPTQPGHAYLWFWLPGRDRPTLAGRVDQDGVVLSFRYSPEYLKREDAIPLFSELPLVPGEQRPRMRIHGCIADASPDAWGRRVILNRRLGAGRHDIEDLTELTYLVSAGPDRIGAMDFQEERGEYRPEESGAVPLEGLLTFAERVDAGMPVPPELDAAILRGSSIGGARPKALLDDSGRKLIAKFGSTSDHYPVVQGEFVAMRLAALCGLDSAPVEMASVMGRPVLLVERFDRPSGGSKRAVVSALTVLGLDEIEARYAGYADLAHSIRKDFSTPTATLRELFSRIVFNILVSNLDDHARNLSAFWDGHQLTLTPAYDICPSPRTGGEAQQVMAIGEDGWRFSQLAGCVERAGTYRLDRAEAEAIIDHQVETIRGHWDEVCDEAGLSQIDRNAMLGRQFLNPFSFASDRSWGTRPERSSLGSIP